MYNPDTHEITIQKIWLVDKQIESVLENWREKWLNDETKKLFKPYIDGFGKTEYMSPSYSGWLEAGECFAIDYRLADRKDWKHPALVELYKNLRKIRRVHVSECPDFASLHQRLEIEPKATKIR